jgi:hypothetical protein
VWKFHVGRKAATAKNVTDEESYILACNKYLVFQQMSSDTSEAYWWTNVGLRGITSQQSVTAVRTSN